MIILRILFYAFLIYLAWRLVFDFILPVYRATRQVKRGFRAMQDHLREHTNAYGSQPHTTQGPAQPQRPAPKNGDYIDFEEID